MKTSQLREGRWTYRPNELKKYRRRYIITIMLKCKYVNNDGINRTKETDFETLKLYYGLVPKLKQKEPCILFFLIGYDLK
jgi:hypothetical protein